jgi:hypothetical protein
MVGTTIDHLVAVTVFLAAILLFISLFNQTIQTAILYQRHRNLATKCSDTLDNILLNPGIPPNWGQTSTSPAGFGLQDPEFTEYRLSPFSLMRLNSSVGKPVFYSKTGLNYSNTTTGFGQSLLTPYNETIDSKTAASLMGINGSYEFSLTLTPTVNVSFNETQLNPLKVDVKVTGAGYPFAYSDISYCFVKNTGIGVQYPNYTITYNVTTANSQGIASLDLGTFDNTRESYALIVYAHTNGLVGVGCVERLRYTDNYAVPLVSDFSSGKVLIAHSFDIVGGTNTSAIAYNATFVLLTEDFALREMLLENTTERTGRVSSGIGQPYGTVTIQTGNPGILVVSYMKADSSNSSGIVLMPWGISSLAFPMTFGDNPGYREWVTTDIRQVIVGDVAYQAKLALWSLEGYQVVS